MATKREIDGRVAIAVIAALVVIVAAAAWWKFAAPQGQLTAAQAGLGKPMHPGEIPGQSTGVASPMNNNAPSGR